MEWISVKDKLPEKKESYLTFSPYKSTVHIRTLSFAPEGTWKWGYNMDDNWDDVVTHWMPLPEPPKAKQWGWDGDHLINRNGNHVLGEQLCTALNGTAQELLEFAGMECECDKRGLFRYVIPSAYGPQISFPFNGYYIVDRKGKRISEGDICDMLNNCCCKHQGDETKQRKPDRQFDFSRDLCSFHYIIRISGDGMPLSPEYVCDLLNNRTEQSEATKRE